MSSSLLYLLDGPSRADVLLGLFNPEVGGKRRVCEVVVASRDGSAPSVNITCTMFAIATPDRAGTTTRLTLWLRCLDGMRLSCPDGEGRMLRVDYYDLHRCSGSVEICNAHPWKGGVESDKAAVTHKIDPLDLMGQFAWRDGQRHPLEFLVDSDALALPAGAVREGKGDFRVELFLRAARSMGSDGRLFRVEARDSDGGSWYGVIDLATKEGFLSKGSHPLREDDAPSAVGDATTQV